jgi:hypothetical protein
VQTYGASDNNPPAAGGPSVIKAPANGGAASAQDRGDNITNAAGKTQVDLIDNKFKMPQVWRSSLAVDYTTPDQWKFTLEGIYTKVIHDLGISAGKHS